MSLKNARCEFASNVVASSVLLSLSSGFQRGEKPSNVKVETNLDFGFQFSRVSTSRQYDANNATKWIRFVVHPSNKSAPLVPSRSILIFLLVPRQDRKLHSQKPSQILVRHNETISVLPHLRHVGKVCCAKQLYIPSHIAFVIV